MSEDGLYKSGLAARKYFGYKRSQNGVRCIVIEASSFLLVVMKFITFSVHWKFPLSVNVQMMMQK